MIRHSAFVALCFLLALTAAINSWSTKSTKTPATPPAQAQVTPQLQAPSVTSGQISGHVSRADTGAPLANAVVMLWTTGRPGYTSQSIRDWRSERTAADGSYARFPTSCHETTTGLSPIERASSVR